MYTASVKVRIRFSRSRSLFTLADAAGDVHIWDRDTAALLRYLRPMNMPELRDMTCIGWNSATDEPMMFATGSHDGTVRVWSTTTVYRETSGSSTEVESESDG